MEYVVTNYNKATKTRVQVMITQERYNQLDELANLTGSSISRIVRLTLDGNADQLDQAIREQRKNGENADFFESTPVAKAAPAKSAKASKSGNTSRKSTIVKPITDDSFAALIKKQKKQ